jgi:hypothetical protein
MLDHMYSNFESLSSTIVFFRMTPSRGRLHVKSMFSQRCHNAVNAHLTPGDSMIRYGEQVAWMRPISDQFVAESKAEARGGHTQYS